ncbi:hypothetical protein C8R43DRAFT_1006168 [Mycena crocata]|nr:hypothetical protein C8R43DRAFT_1006168 [Mycena crocata]
MLIFVPPWSASSSFLSSSALQYLSASLSSDTNPHAPFMPPNAFVDSSNRRESTPHAHLYPTTSSAPRKVPPTLTIPPTNGSVAHCEHAKKAAGFPPASAHCSLVPGWSQSSDSDSASGCGAHKPQCRVGPRARTDHDQTPRTAQLGTPKPPKTKVSKRRGQTPNRLASELASLRLAALIECSVSHHLRTRHAQAIFNTGKVVQVGDRHELLKQDELLVARLSSIVALRRHVSRAVAIPICTPSVPLLDGIGIIKKCEKPPLPIFPDLPSIRFITIPTSHRRRGSSVFNHGNTLSLSALVALLILRRNNEHGSMIRRAVTPTPPHKRKLECCSPSPLLQVMSSELLEVPAVH